MTAGTTTLAQLVEKHDGRTFPPARSAPSICDLDHRESAGRVDRLADLALASGCSPATFTAIFGPARDPLDYLGWRLAMVRGDWIATKAGRKTLRSNTLGGIYAAVKRTARHTQGETA